MISKIKDLFDAAKYKRKYNTLLNEHETLIINCSNTLVKTILSDKGTKDALKKINDEVNTLKGRISDLETKKARSNVRK